MLIPLPIYQQIVTIRAAILLLCVIKLSATSIISKSTTAFLPFNIIHPKGSALGNNAAVDKQQELRLSSTNDDVKRSYSIALTREEGKNKKLLEKIINHPLHNNFNFKLIEMPCVEHAIGPDIPFFIDILKKNDGLSKYDYIVITSPESAKVFANVINTNTKGIDSSLLPAIAAVGKATETALVDLGFQVSFTPSKANGLTLGNELPPINNKVELHNVLYPASAKADTTIKEVLEKRKDCSFTVTRLNTYDTVPVTFTDEAKSIMMNEIDMACFGSPSSVHAWLSNTENDSNGNVIAVCIGGTTAKACIESGKWERNNIYYPETNPGMVGWVENCFIAANDLMEKDFWNTMNDEQ